MPSEVQTALYKVHQLAVSCAGTVAQRAALAIFEEPQRLYAHRPHYVTQQQEVCAILDELGLKYIRPEGAFYCLVRLHGAHASDSMRLTMALLERENVVVIPGSAFGPASEGFVRITFTPSPNEMRTGLTRLAAILT
jgi:aminotransferase